MPTVADAVADTRAPDLIRGLQERAAHALPPTRLEHLDGWWLRHSDGGSWWVSSVLPHGATAPADLPDRIRAAEEFYARHGAPSRFQISPGAGPAGLDDMLAERGYRTESPMSLQSAVTAHVTARLAPDAPGVRVAPDAPRVRVAPDALRVRVDELPTDAWFAAWWAVHGAGADPGAERDILRRVRRPSGYASVLAGPEVVAVGRAVADTGWAGLFGMATLPHARGGGAARQVLAALARWSARQGAEQLYLQVGCDNSAARRLYERAGFTERCRYHYRTIARAPVCHS